MNRRLPALFAFVMLCACGQGTTIEQKRAALEGTKRQAYADVIRHEGECKAVAFEFPRDSQLLQGCLDTHRLMIEAAQRTAKDVDKRLAELEQKGR
jgi:hypothetical protein